MQKFTRTHTQSGSGEVAHEWLLKESVCVSLCVRMSGGKKRRDREREGKMCHIHLKTLKILKYNEFF